MSIKQMVISIEDYNSYMYLLEQRIKDIKMNYYNMKSTEDKQWHVETFKPKQEEYYTKWVELNDNLKGKAGYYLAEKQRELRQSIL